MTPEDIREIAGLAAQMKSVAPSLEKIEKSIEKMADDQHKRDVAFAEWRTSMEDRMSAGAERMRKNEEARLECFTVHEAKLAHMRASSAKFAETATNDFVSKKEVRWLISGAVIATMLLTGGGVLAVLKALGKLC